jgi:hypothetical protein
MQQKQAADWENMQGGHVSHVNDVHRSPKKVLNNMMHINHAKPHVTKRDACNRLICC